MQTTIYCNSGSNQRSEEHNVSYYNHGTQYWSDANHQGASRCSLLTIINPRRMHHRVTVVVLCVCLCLSVTKLAATYLVCESKV